MSFPSIEPGRGGAGGPVESLYVHVPFCAHKCEYCAFYSGQAPGELIQRYVDALIRELELIAPDCRPGRCSSAGEPRRC